MTTNTKEQVKKACMTSIGTLNMAKADATVLGVEVQEYSDEFATLYDINTAAKALSPPYDLKLLRHYVRHNSILLPCISAMVTNIGGTGFTIEAKDTALDGDALLEATTAVRQYFDEPYPNLSWTALRKSIQQDLEEVGIGYMEVLRSKSGAITFFRRVDAANLRIVKSDAAINVTATVQRNGEDIKVTYKKRERRFVYKIANSKAVYYKEFGASREINLRTGEWLTKSDKAIGAITGTEILMFGNIPDTDTPYSIPRWINQTPSVIGSRKAEESNIYMLNSGGIPPVLIFLEGGELTPEIRLKVENLLSSPAGTNINKGAVIEIPSMDGSLDGTGSTPTVRVHVERFGSESVNDSMYENYDATTERKIRTSFRLPPMFVGRAEDYSYATAFVSYSVAEAQVFAPERSEFDDIINNTIMKEIAPDFIFKSNALSIKDVQRQLEAIKLAVLSGGTTYGKVLTALTAISGMDLAADATFFEKVIEPKPQVNNNVDKPTDAISKSDNTFMADDYYKQMYHSGSVTEELQTKVNNLTKSDKDDFDRALVEAAYGDTATMDITELSDLCHCALGGSTNGD